MAELTRARTAVAALVFMRVIYAINWLNIGAIFFAMEPDFNVGVLGLGTLTSAFYLGVGLMQVPGGVMAAKWGPKKVVVLGTMISSLSALATGLAPSLFVAAVLRFIVGAGMAFVFAPAVVMISGLLRGGRSGMGVGIFNSAFDLGGIFALFGWALIAELTGWRASLELSGVLGVASGILVMTTVPVDETKLEFRVRGEQLLKVLAHKQLIIIGLAMLGVSIGNGLVSSFMEYYLKAVFGVSAAVAGIIASMIVAVPIFSAVYAGHIYDRMKRPRALLLLSNVVMAGALFISAVPSIVAALACTLLGGLISGVGFTVGFAAAKDSNAAEKEYDGVAVAWVNSISLLGAFFPPLAFSYVASLSGYPYAWAAGALITLVFALPLAFMKETVER